MTKPKNMNDIVTSMKRAQDDDALVDDAMGKPIVLNEHVEGPNDPARNEWRDNPGFTPMQNKVIQLILQGGNVQEDCFMVMGAIVGTLSMLKSQGALGIEVTGVEALQMLMDGIAAKTSPEQVVAPAASPSSDMALILQGMQSIADRLDTYETRLRSVESK